MEHSALIIIPLLCLVMIAIVMIGIPMFANNSTVSNSTKQGLTQMSDTLANFAPIYGIGLAIGVLVMFFTLANWFARGGAEVDIPALPREEIEPFEEEETKLLDLWYKCPYCNTIVHYDEDGRCNHCGGTLKIMTKEQLVESNVQQ